MTKLNPKGVAAVTDDRTLRYQISGRIANQRVANSSIWPSSNGASVADGHDGGTGNEENGRGLLVQMMIPR